MKHEWSQPVKKMLARQEHDGTTRYAIDMIKSKQSKLERLAYVELRRPFGRDAVQDEVRFIDTLGSYIEVDGLSWGYAGEGPHGLLKAFKVFDLPFELALIASWDFDHAVIDAQNLLVHNCTCKPEVPQSYTVAVNGEIKLKNVLYMQAWNEYAHWVTWALNKQNGTHVEMTRDSDGATMHRSWRD